jgi:CRISPR-associated protein Cmr2
MQAGLLNHLESQKMDDWKDPSWIVYLFGNEKGENKDFCSGTLVFYPTWFTKVGFEVINPHCREKRSGKQPIYYEVVPAETEGVLRLLYAPLPGEKEKVAPEKFIGDFINSIKALLETYGISAKRTAGWGGAKIHPENEKSSIYFVKGGWVEQLVGDPPTEELYEPPTEYQSMIAGDKDTPLLQTRQLSFDELMKKIEQSTQGDSQ